MLSYWERLCFTTVFLIGNFVLPDRDEIIEDLDIAWCMGMGQGGCGTRPTMENFMKKISVVKVQDLKTTSVALYPIWTCWPY